MKKLLILMFLAVLSVSSAYANQDCAKVEGTVWYDENGDGIQNDSATLDTDGIKVYLYRVVDDKPVKETVVGKNGHYEFDAQCIWYYIKVDKGNYDSYSPENRGNDKSKDSDVNEYNGASEQFSLGSDETKTIDAGLKGKSSLKGTVWFDEDGNGIQDNSESGVEGVTVHLLKDGEDTGITTTTDEDGNYKFSDLECGYNYSIKVDKPSDYDKFTIQNIGDDTKDSDVNDNGASDEVNVAECQEYDNLDAGLACDEDDSNNSGGSETKTACLGDFLWYDKKLNGIQDADEPGVVGVGVYLYDNSGNLLATTQTDSDGKYSFCGLSDGEYKVKFDLPNTYLFTKRDSGDDTKDSDADSNGWSHGVSIKSGKSDYSIDAGIYCECDDYQVNPNGYKKLSAGVSFGMALGLLIFVFIAISSLKYKRDKS